MIKEIEHVFDKNNNYYFGKIEILNNIENTFLKKIPLLEANRYYKNIFDEIGVVKIKKNKKFKHADRMPIYLWYDFWCVSAKFKSIFEGKLKGYWYPTDDQNYFVFLPDNYLDLINKDKTEIKYSEEELSKPYQYEYIENLTFKEDSHNEYLFTVPEFYRKWLATENFELVIKENNLTGFQFYKEINYKRKNGLEFDWLRRKKYNVDGDVIE